MSKTIACLALLSRGVLALAGDAALAQAPEQAERGRKVFLQRNCAQCHRFDGHGTAVGPDLTAIARLSPRAIALTVLATRTQNVISMKLKSGETFPAIKAGSGDDAVMPVYDLRKTPPELRKIERAQVESTRDNEAWKHPPSTTEMPDDQLADVIAYLRWVAVRDRKGVDPSEVR
jgi:putative heme-binding domain-containing protein